MTDDKKARLRGEEGNKLLALVVEQCEEHKAFLIDGVNVDLKIGYGHKLRLLQQIDLLTATPAPMVVSGSLPPQAIAVYTYEDELYAYLSQPLEELPEVLHSSRVTEGVTLPEHLDTAVDTSPLTGKTKTNAAWRG